MELFPKLPAAFQGNRKFGNSAPNPACCEESRGWFPVFPRVFTPGCSFWECLPIPALFQGQIPWDFLEQELLPWGFPEAPAAGRAAGIPQGEQIPWNPRKTWEWEVVSCENQGWNSSENEEIL